MITSPEKLEDMRARSECLMFMEICLELGEIELAKEFGDISATYGVMLKGDYTERDTKWALYHKIFNYI